ncbi:MAG TPA: 2-hydroxyacyl-CoA dehydratase [Dissulfuribacter thermophilus]|uniref:2-hydroxyacyl-CoA dehydratase n=1 Tax=Dissulfuribacter thermophilus TaxID=1156395 RepID=A0A7V2SYL4_9BACT|nr:2-hydroxyacyl-CoA dehydratase [Dissulfuribacter thermophilus]
MKDKYDEMWEKLDLDISAHEALLTVLGQFYNDIYLTQQGRLNGMEYLDFVMSEVHGLRIKELQDAKAEGRKVIGTFCVFVPEELILATNAVCVGLCAGAETGFDLAERYLPRNTCPLIKSFFGFHLARLCPYMSSCDMVVGETTCDGKKKAYEIFGKLKPTYVMEVPQTKSPDAMALFRSEIVRFKQHLERLTGVTITPEKLAQSIKIVNRRRKALQRLNELRRATPAPISGRDALLINQIAFYDDPLRFAENIEKLCDELSERVNNGQGIVPEGTKRVLISGCPMAIPNWKLPYVVESSGAVIVGEESCIGYRNTRDLVREDGETLDELLDALTERYMKIDCACFTPNEERLDHIVTLARELKVDGVIHYALQFCQPYSIEATRVEERLAEEDIPFLRIETDYSMEDTGALKTRVEAFIETLD